MAGACPGPPVTAPVGFPAASVSICGDLIWSSACCRHPALSKDLPRVGSDVRADHLLGIQREQQDVVAWAAGETVKRSRLEDRVPAALRALSAAHVGAPG